MEGVPKQFASPEEEVAFLREQLAQKEREVIDRTPDLDDAERATIAKEQLKEYTQFTPKLVLDKNYQLDDLAVAATAAHLETAQDPVDEILLLAREKGIKNALTVLEKTKNSFVIDEVHRKLVQELHGGVRFTDLKEGVPPWHVLHMTLYEVAMPSAAESEVQFTSLVGTMQQLFAGLRTIGSADTANHFVFEVATANESEDIIFYVAVPDEFTALFEKQVHSLFPHAVLTQQAHDYNIFVDGGHTIIAPVTLKKFFGYPLRLADEFSSDPITVLLNAFSKIERAGEGAAIQFVIRHPTKAHRKRVEKVIQLVEKGESVSSAIASTSVTGNIAAVLGDIFGGSKQSVVNTEKNIDHEAVELLRKKIKSELVEVNIRLAISAPTKERAEQILQELASTFNQFDTPNANGFVVRQQTGRKLKVAEKAFSFRQFLPNEAQPFSLEELSTLIHFPPSGTQASPQLKQSYAKTSPAPNDMPTDGTLLGVNKYRGAEKPIYITETDRMRHFYVIGQTGTGKSVFLQNLIVQDIRAGAGVCMIDPHGSDIEDVLGAIPPERHQDVIYFDPAYLERSMGLNMLEYDPTKPEQKTFIVNELLSIFQKLYGANPEALGPMFEQYFRNATMLAMEDPDSGSTLLDIGRVMADAKFRRAKLAKATNPTVVQFWKEIAGKAGGEASLENIVPYIVGKIDPLTANDYIRPIIGQQTSSLNFRRIMDERKILLVNLSKGRLGDVNANLIGMIVVGKILMAALSRVDDPSKSFPPFYLHIDEFQNISTPAIASILSEARKYKLGLSMAHQFIAQLQPDIKDAVFGNVGSMAVFRVGNEDALELESQFAPHFTANDIMNTPNFNAIVRVLANGVPTPAFSIATEPPPASDSSVIQSIIEQSFATYGRPRAEIEAEIQTRYQKPVPGTPPHPQP
jgi:hypothetical protein